MNNYMIVASILLVGCILRLEWLVHVTKRNSSLANMNFEYCEEVLVRMIKGEKLKLTKEGRNGYNNKSSKTTE